MTKFNLSKCTIYRIAPTSIHFYHIMYYQIFNGKKIKRPGKIMRNDTYKMCPQFIKMKLSKNTLCVITNVNIPAVI